jgi:hypothetical protein
MFLMELACIAQPSKCEIITFAEGQLQICHSQIHALAAFRPFERTGLLRGIPLLLVWQWYTIYGQ